MVTLNRVSYCLLPPSFITFDILLSPYFVTVWYATLTLLCIFKILHVNSKSSHTFILLANSLAYSEASSLFFWVRCLLRAIRRRLCCRTRGVTSLWILGALVLGFLPVKKKKNGVRHSYNSTPGWGKEKKNTWLCGGSCGEINKYSSNKTCICLTSSPQNSLIWL